MSIASISSITAIGSSHDIITSTGLDPSFIATATISSLFAIATLSPTTSSASTSTSIATAIATSTPNPAMTTASALAGHKPENTGECSLLGPFALLVQAALGALALLSLVYKRWRERPQRPVKIWAFDVSKQVFGTVLLHLANLFMSMFSAGEIGASVLKAAAESVAAETGTGKGGGREKYQPNPCSFYLLNLGIDTTVGIVVLVLLLRVLNVAARYTPLARPPESIESGNYGDPPRATWWLKQSIVYFLGLLGMKACVFLLFQLCPWIVRVGDWALRWTEGNEAVQIAFVMFIFPLIMNAMQYWIIDMFIKKKQTADKEGVDADADGDAGEQGGLLAGEDGGAVESVETDETVKTGARTEVRSYQAPEEDERETSTGESSSSTATSQLDVENARLKSVEI